MNKLIPLIEKIYCVRDGQITEDGKIFTRHVFGNAYDEVEQFKISSEYCFLVKLESIRYDIFQDSRYQDKDKFIDILKMRYGFFDGKTHTLAEVAKYFSTNIERVRFVLGRMERLLRHPNYTCILFDEIGETSCADVMVEQKLKFLSYKELKYLKKVAAELSKE